MGVSKMKWQQDLIKDIRFNDWRDDRDGGIFPHPSQYSGSVEFTECNRSHLTEKFIKIKDSCRAILEIGVCRNADQSSTWCFLNNKKKETFYFGIDLDEKSFLNNPEHNIYTINSNSSNIENNMNYIKQQGIDCFDFIFIDGWHSVNQVLIDWEYTNWLSDRGIVGFHDTSAHPGPLLFVNALDKNKWTVEENLCPADHGIGFCWKK
jgi:hypothetical protein